MDDQLRAALREHLDDDDLVDHLVDAWIGDGDVIARTLISAVAAGSLSDLKRIKPFVPHMPVGRFYDQRGANTVVLDVEPPTDAAGSRKYADRRTGQRNPAAYIPTDRRCFWPKCERSLRNGKLCPTHTTRKRRGLPMNDPITMGRPRGWRRD